MQVVGMSGIRRAVFSLLIAMFVVGMSGIVGSEKL